MNMYETKKIDSKGKLKKFTLDSTGFIDLCKKTKKIQENDRFFMSFSGGSDSIALFLRVLESGQFDMKKGVYFFYYSIPDISWVEEYLDYFENKYEIKIERVPSSNFMFTLCHYHLQNPSRAFAMEKMSKTREWWIHSIKDIEDAVKEYHDLPDTMLAAVGTKQGDSFVRRVQLRKNQGIDIKARKWYPIWDFENGDVPRIIKKHDIKMPLCYDLFGISFEGLDYRFSKVIKEKCPENWKRIKKMYPLIETVITRYEKYVGSKEVRGVYYKKFSDRTLKPIKPL